QAVPAQTQRVLLEIAYNLWDKPITKELLSDTSVFKDFHAGLPGTNYKATAAQYEALVEQIEQLDLVHEPQLDYHTRPIPSLALNTILYGPPGTGKTYQTVNHALAIIEQRSLEELALEDRSELRTRFENHLQNGRIQFVSFHQSFSYEDFVEGIKPKTLEGDIYYKIEDGIFKRIAKAAERDWEAGKRYVLIIDEINRGNIAGIFGELITLIEADKRMAAREMLSLQLPYSKATFAVPPNLYLIGTMNTADRNVDLLDIALRRRFTFQEVLPQPALLRQQAVEAGVELDKLLERINQRIHLLLSVDYCIGHAYFYDVSTLDELRDLFALKIIPLLQEYFLGDLGKVGLVLGRAFVEEVRIGNYELLADFSHESTGNLLTQKSYQLRSKTRWTETDF
ncbi:MAG: AAA family ATPase, partial [Bacteroidota bacterium]